ncbi:MAG: methylmalonyl-CoA/ethylmalonyl-CoA epimerase [Thermoproteota archaeon]|nr:methylmalonyl-CoA/ethylmalonyl-CoA epimerase [Thermoproteota archaeon]
MALKNVSESSTNTITKQMLFNDSRHIGIVVRDIEKTAEFYSEKLGLTFNIRIMEHSGLLHGKPMKYKAKIAHAKIGSTTFELLQPMEGNSLFEEFLKKQGEGIHHIAVDAPVPLETEIEKWEKLGINALQIDNINPGEGTAYMDVPGCMIELLCFKRK